MRFKKFVNWCNERACDGRWGMIEAMTCVSIIQEIRQEPFWRREKLWKTKYKKDVLEQIVWPIEDKIQQIKQFQNDRTEVQYDHTII